jgi:hypothetical protein
MPTIASGSNATITVAAGQILTVQSDGATFDYENPVGTRVGEYSCDSVFGPFAAGGSVKITSVQGAVYYELGTAQSSNTAYNPSNVAITGGVIGGATVAAVGLLKTDTAILGTLGDSRIASAYVSNGAAPNIAISTPCQSIVGWACFLSNQRIKSASAYNKAVSGSLVSDIAGQYANLAAVSPRCTHVLILAGTNSFSSGVSGQTAWSQLSPVLDSIRNDGRQAIVILDLPRANASWGSASQRDNSLWFNQLIRKNAPQQGAWLIDPSRYLADPASTTGDPLAGYYYDTPALHPATLGGYYIGKDVCDSVISRLLIPSLPGFTNRADVYSATNPTGNALANGLFMGTTGTNQSSGGAASGTVATGWLNRTLSGTGTSVASLVARTDGKPGNWQQLVFTSGSGVSTYRLSPDPLYPAPGTNYPSGVPMVLEGDLNVSSASGLESLSIALSNYDGSSIRAVAQAFGSGLIGATYFPYPSTFSGRFRTDPLPYDALATQILVRLEAQVNTGAATIQIGNVEMRPA